MTLQSIYFYAGIAGFCLAALFAILAVVYFFKADVRGVYADLTGKEKTSDQKETSRRRKKAKRVTAQSNEPHYEGGIEHVEMRERSGNRRRSADSYETKQNPKAVLREKQDAAYAQHGEAVSAFRVVVECMACDSAYYLDADGNLLPQESKEEGRVTL